MKESMVPFLKVNFNPLGTVTAPFGSIDKVHTTPHTGVDIAVPIGTELYSPVDGVVSKIVNQPSGLGKGLFIKTETGYQFIFGHLSEFKVKLGQIVHHGDLIALSGSTGRSTGPHLHLGLIDNMGRFIDPLTYTIDKATSAFAYAESIDANIYDLFQLVSQIPLAV